MSLEIDGLGTTPILPIHSAVVTPSVNLTVVRSRSSCMASILNLFQLRPEIK